MPIPSTDKNASVQPYVLCNTCVGIINAAKDFVNGSSSIQLSEELIELQRPIVAQYNVPDLQRSGLDGCHFCSIISQSLVPVHSAEDVLSSSTLIVTIRMGVSRVNPPRYGSSTMPSLDVWLTEKDGTNGTKTNLPLVTDSDALPVESEDARWSISTESDVMFNLAKEWLHDCVSKHRLCEEVRQTAISSNQLSFPEYLVRVTEDSLHLCHTESLHTRPSYLTLSHRWGKSQIFTLTSHNLSSLLSDIPIQALPKTFQDAIKVTRRMGHSYIWIDSLCIIQDSREHWEKESAIMGDIYRSSAFTIAALGATNGDSGCFKTRNPLCFQPFKFEAGPGRYDYLSSERERKSFKYTGYGTNVEPLHERGWVVQERMLSPRTLFYGSFGLYWECVQQEASSMITKRMSVTYVKYAIHQACNLAVSGIFDQSYRAFWQWWTTIITTYSPCGLTYGSDKLVAIGGIVRLAESKTGMHSVAGLWKEYLLPELLWFVERPSVRPIGAYQAPTWSWASLNTAVTPGIQDFNYSFSWKIKVLDVGTNVVSANGQISSAHIKISGPLLRVRYKKSGTNYQLRWGKIVPLVNSSDDRVCFLPDVIPDPDQELWALHIVSAISTHAYMNMGIVVTKENDADDTWIRVGSFRQYDWPSNPTTFFQDGLAEMTTLVIL